MTASNRTLPEFYSSLFIVEYYNTSVVNNSEHVNINTYSLKETADKLFRRLLLKKIQRSN